MTDQNQDENRLIAERREKLKAIREKANAFPNDWSREDTAAEFGLFAVAIGMRVVLVCYITIDRSLIFFHSYAASLSLSSEQLRVM